MRDRRSAGGIARVPGCAPVWKCRAAADWPRTDPDRRSRRCHPAVRGLRRWLWRNCGRPGRAEDGSCSHPGEGIGIFDDAEIGRHQEGATLTPRRARRAARLPSPYPGVTRVHRIVHFVHLLRQRGLDNFIRRLGAARGDPADTHFGEGPGDLCGRGFSGELLGERERLLRPRWKMPWQSL